MATTHWFLVPAVLLAACSRALPTASPGAQPPPAESESRAATSAPPDGAGATSTMANRRIEDPNEYAVPQLLPFDGIPPVYDPRFVDAMAAPLHDDELVIGASLGGEAKAYPITVLRFREMVDDELAGIPILVTW